ncbi:protein phosphatase 2C domain-containing protein [Streptomyces abyssomicinicus]|uniref:protein phosphatase 2C domain-containing protein n=1 Tax=Streptomyces abyssomicinicus TaxID=574929 RepID=UPI00124F8293|nr:protein phosphatase 2C domain-containing protein [Streptomyces abyssomicinicus]
MNPAGPVNPADPVNAADPAAPPGTPSAAPEPELPAVVPEQVRGLPEHVGKRPPAYPPYPKAKPSLNDGDTFAALTPEIVLDGLLTDGLAVRGVSVRGDSHRWDGSCRQDAMTITRIGAPGKELLVLAVADGVGSSKRSHVAAHDATRRVAGRLHQFAADLHQALAQEDLATLNGLANRVIATSVEDLRRSWGAGSDPDYSDRDYATTLHVLLVPSDPALRQRALIGVGDGGLLILRDGRWYGGSGTGADEAMVDTRTAALPASYGSAVTNIVTTAPGDVLVLGTDGIVNPINQEREVAERLAGYWGSGEVPALSDFLWQAQLRARTYDDDRTVICVWEGATR